MVYHIYMVLEEISSKHNERYNILFQCDSFFTLNTNAIRLLSYDIEAKNAEINAIRKSISDINNYHLNKYVSDKRISALSSAFKNSISFERLCILDSLINSHLPISFVSGESFKRLETLLFGEAFINKSTIEELNNVIDCLNKSNCTKIARIAHLTYCLLKSKCRIETITLFTLISLSNDYSELIGPNVADSLLNHLVQPVSLNKSKDATANIEEFYSLINKSLQNAIITLRRQIVSLQMYTPKTNNTLFNDAYKSALIFLGKQPTARDIMEVTPIPRRTVYRMLERQNYLIK